MTKVTVSFKKTTRDMRLYTLVMAMEEKSEFMKDALEFFERYRSYEPEIDMLIKKLEQERVLSLDKKA
ncbi:hypothetical protein SDC9_182541 [bioreactor metagenome]|uniref:Uncharacterized protein n=1 Tax=bioreactor metagenome TaxID=1076179 RepID=A0A645H7N7_9ZZZZ